MPLNLAAYKPVVNTEGDANQIANGLTAIENYLNGNFEPAGIKQTGAALGQALLWDGTKWAPGTVVVSPIVFRKVTAKVVTASVVETDLLNGEFTLAANALGLNKVLRLSLRGDATFNNAGSPPRVKLKLGAATLLDTSTPAQNVNASAVVFGWRIDVQIMNLGVANAQHVFLEGRFGTNNGLSAAAKANFAAGNGAYVGQTGAMGSLLDFMGTGSGAVDTTVANVLQVTTTNGIAGAYTVQLLSAVADIP